MNESIALFKSVPTPVWLAIGWAFSALCSSMPPLPDKAGYKLTWAHNFLQMAAANPHKLRS